MPEFHNQILAVGQKLGYYTTNYEGTCNGYTLKWLESCLLDKEEEAQFEQFKQAIINAYQQNDIHEQVNRVKVKVKCRALLTEEDLALLNLLAFYEAMALYQDPLKYRHIFNKTYSQHDVSSTSYLAGSKKIYEKGGLTTVYSEISIYSKIEIQNLLDQFEEVMDKTNYPENNIAFLVTSEDHAIGLVYQKTTRQWRLKDINNDNSSDESILQSKEQIIDEIYLGLKNYYSKIESLEKGLLRHIQEEVSEFISKSPDAQNEEYKLTTSMNGQNIDIIYLPKSHEWIFQSSNGIKNLKSIHALAQEIGTYGIKTSPIPFVTFGISVIARKDLADSFRLEENFLNFKIPPVFTPDMLLIKNFANIACIAASMNDLLAIKKLVALGVDLNTAKQHNGCNPLMLAAQYGFISIVKFLINYVDINARDNEGMTASYLAAAFNQPEIIEILSDAGANLNIAMNDGATPAIIGALKGNFEAIKTLIRCNANLNQASLSGLTPLFAAAQEGYKDIVEELLMHQFININVDAFQGATPVYIASQNGHSDIIELLASKHANINQSLSNGSTPLHVAVQFGQIAAVEVLIKYNANVNAHRTDGITPAYLACIEDNMGVLKLLSENGADLKEYYDGSTLLFIAASQRKVSIVDFLLEKGINLENLPNIKTSTELISLAQSFKSEAIVHQMEEFIQTQLKTGVSPDQIVILSRDFAYITNQHEIVTLFDLHHSRKVISNAKETTHQLRDKTNHVSASESPHESGGRKHET